MPKFEYLSQEMSACGKLFFPSKPTNQRERERGGHGRSYKSLLSVMRKFKAAASLHKVTAAHTSHTHTLKTFRYKRKFTSDVGSAAESYTAVILMYSGQIKWMRCVLQ